MKLLTTVLIAAGISSLISIAATARAAAPESESQITILYDAFGTDPSMTKDWGFSALVEVAGKRILFDTGNDAEIFAANVKAKGVDLKTLDFVVLSHRHSDHMAGLNYVLSVNPTVKIYAPKEGFGIYGSSLPSSFYRKDETLPSEMRYYGGVPPQVMKFGAAWRGANFELIDKTTEIAPGMTLIALTDQRPRTSSTHHTARASEYTIKSTPRFRNKTEAYCLLVEAAMKSLTSPMLNVHKRARSQTAEANIPRRQVCSDPFTESGSLTFIYPSEEVASPVAN
jgi:Metallo-beta-lactamase superfamily